MFTCKADTAEDMRKAVIAKLENEKRWAVTDERYALGGVARRNAGVRKFAYGRLIEFFTELVIEPKLQIKDTEKVTPRL